MSPAAPIVAVWAEARLLLACVAAAIALGVAITWPTILDIRTVSSISRFAEGHIAALGIMARTPPWETWTPLAGAPHGVDFRPLLWPVGLLARATGAVAAYNLLLIATPALNLLGGWLLGKALGLGGNRAAALGAALSLPAWVRVTLQNGQPEQALLGSGALLIAAVVWASRGSAARMALIPVATFGLGVATPHVVLGSLVVAGAFGVFTRRLRPLITASLALLGALAVGEYHSPGFDTSVPHFFAPFGLLDAAEGPVPKRSIQWLELILPAALPPGKAPFVLHLGYVGLPLFAGAAWAASRWMRSGRNAGQADPSVLGFGVAGVACIGFAAADAGLFAPFSATLAASGTPYRFILGAVLAFSVAAAYTRGIWPVAILSLAEAVQVDPRALPFPTWRLPNDVSSADIARRTVGFDSTPESAARDAPADIIGRDRILLDLPPPGTCRSVAGHYLIEAGEHGLPVPLSLRSGADALPHAPTLSGQLESALNAPDCPGQLAPLLAGFDVVVAHRHDSCLLRETQLRCIQTVLGTGHQTSEVSWWFVAPAH